MSDILIKGMELPKSCRRCMEMEIPIRCRVMKEEPVTAVMSGYGRPSDCPLVEVKPHGRLIDENDLVRLIEDNYGCGVCKNKADEERCLDRCKWAVLLNDIDSLPTVLEASE